MRYVVDTPVFVGTVLPEANSNLCLDFMGELFRLHKTVLVFEPFLFSYELIISVARGSKPGAVSRDEANRRVVQALTMIRALLDRPNTEIIPLDQVSLAEWLPRAEANGFRTNNRTQDDIFLSLAVQKDATLVTLDENILQRPQCSVGRAKVRAPYDALKELQK